MEQGREGVSRRTLERSGERKGRRMDVKISRSEARRGGLGGKDAVVSGGKRDVRDGRKERMMAWGKENECRGTPSEGLYGERRGPGKCLPCCLYIQVLVIEFCDLVSTSYFFCLGYSRLRGTGSL